MKLRVPRLFLLQALPQKPSAAGKQRQIAYVQALKTCKMEDQQHKPHRQSTDTEKRRQHAHAEPPDPNGFRQIPVGQDKAAHARRADHHQCHRRNQPRFHRRRSHHNTADGGDRLSNGLRQVNSGFLQQLIGNQQPQNLRRCGKRHHFFIQ